MRDFATEHTKRLHLIAVRRDLTGFQHLHPRQDADGTWSTDLELPDAGAYRVFADFRPAGGAATTLSSDVLVGGAFAPRALPAPRNHHARRRLRRRAARRRRHGEPRGDAHLLGQPRRTAGRRASPTSAPPATSSRCERAIWPTSTSIRWRAEPTSTAHRVRRDLPVGRPLPPVPAVPPRRPRAHRRADRRRSRPHEHRHRPRRAADQRHDLRVVREPRRARAQQARRRRPRRVNYATEKATIDFDPGSVEPAQLIAAVAGGRLRGVPAGDRRRPRRGRRATQQADELAPLRYALIALARCWPSPSWRCSMVPPLQFDNWQWLALHAGRARSWSGARGRSTAPRGATCATARRPWTRSSRSASWPPSAGRSTRCSSATPGMTGMTMTLYLVTERGAGDELYLEVAGGGDGVPARRPLLRGAGQAPRRCRACDALLELGAKDVAVLDADGAERRVRDRAARRRRPLRRAPGREGRHRRRGRARALSAVDAVAADRRVRAGREVGPGDERRGRDRQRRRAAGRRARRRSAPTRRWPRSPASSPTRRPARRRSSGSPTGSPAVFVPGGDRARRRHAGLLAGQPAMGTSAAFTAAVAVLDHRLPLRAGPRHADGAAGRHRPRRAAGHR